MKKISPPKKECELCGKIFKKNKATSWNNWENKVKFCSRKCYATSLLKSPVMVKCIGCGEHFKRDIEQGQQNRKYCSQKCYRKNLDITKKINYNPKRHSDEKIQCACGCKKQIDKYDYRGRVKKYAIGHTIKGRKRIFTDEWLEKIHQSNIIKGKNHSKENHWNWKGGISTEEHLLRGTPKYNEWRKAVYKRDNWTCQECKVKQKNPVAHHIKSFADYPKLRYKLKNGITYCRKCHLKIHKELKS